jgi:hypothetical protein
MCCESSWCQPSAAWVAAFSRALVLSVALSTILAKWADGNVRDPNIPLAGAVLLSMVAGIACIIPARHACAIDTMRALRHD